MAKTKDYPPDEPKNKGGNFTEEAKTWFYSQVRLGRNPYVVGQQIEASRPTVRKWMKAVSGRYIEGDSLTPLQVRNRMYEQSAEHKVADLMTVSIPPPITRFEDLQSDQAKNAYHEFGYWRTRYLGRRHIPWQVEMAHIVMSWLIEAQQKEERIRGVLNTPPGGGKTTTMTHDLPAWAICRNRDLRVALGSNTTPQATKYTRRLRNTLERNTLLNVDFGNFKPEETEVWRQDEFLVDGVTGQEASIGYMLALSGFDAEDPHVKRRLDNEQDEIWDIIRANAAVFMAGEKESTVTALSYQMHFLGGRYDMNLWDDLVDDKNSDAPEKRDDLAEWWEEYAVSRAEPGGMIGLIGTRFGKYDLFRHCRDMTFATDDDFDELLAARISPNMDAEQMEEIREELAKELVDNYGIDSSDLQTVENLTPDEDGYVQPVRIRQRIYKYVKFPAHDDSKCHNLSSMKQADHIDCLLDPLRFKFYDLMRAKNANARKYELTYNQADESTEDNLIQEVWLTGGVGQDGILYPGCFNYNRTLLQIPKHLSEQADDGTTPKEDCFSIATVDPSAVNWWSIQWWIWNDNTDEDFLVDIIRARLSADSFLSYSPRDRAYHGVLDTWQKRSRDMGWPIGLWIVEQNAAQRYLFQHTFVQEWMKINATHIKGHETTPKKADEEYGVQVLRPRYRDGRVDLPYSGDDLKTRAKINEFKAELVEWPDSPTDDMVHGHWFLEANRYKIPKTLKVPTSGGYNGVKHPYQDTMPPRLAQQSYIDRSKPDTDGGRGISHAEARRRRNEDRNNGR